MSTFHERKAWRTDYYKRFVHGWQRTRIKWARAVEAAHGITKTGEQP